MTVSRQYKYSDRFWVPRTPMIVTRDDGLKCLMVFTNRNQLRQVLPQFSRHETEQIRLQYLFQEASRAGLAGVCIDPPVSLVRPVVESEGVNAPDDDVEVEFLLFEAAVDKAPPRVPMGDQVTWSLISESLQMDLGNGYPSK